MVLNTQVILSDVIQQAREKVNLAVSLRRSRRMAIRTLPTPSYSQFGEDAVLQAFLPPGDGFYIDIGSGHPTQGSNTYALYLMGWRGILIDPIASNISLSQAVRPGDTCILGLCGDADGDSVEFFEFEIYQYSTMLPGRAKEVEKLGHKVKSTYELTVTTVAEQISSLTFDGPTVLSIDVEGAEYQVLQGNDWDHFRPDLICVEEWEPPLLKSTEVSGFLATKGYTLIAVTGFSSIYQLRSSSAEA